jgi:hypothetical protein
MGDPVATKAAHAPVGDLATTDMGLLLVVTKHHRLSRSWRNDRRLMCYGIFMAATLAPGRLGSSMGCFALLSSLVFAASAPNGQAPGLLRAGLRAIPVTTVTFLTDIEGSGATRATPRHTEENLGH